MIKLAVTFLPSHKKCAMPTTVGSTIHYNTRTSFMTHNLLGDKSFSIMGKLENFLQLSKHWNAFAKSHIVNSTILSVLRIHYASYSLTNPFATPVFEEPPPPPTNTWRLVNICNVYSGKLTRANNPSCFLSVGAIILQTFHTIKGYCRKFHAVLYSQYAFLGKP